MTERKINTAMGRIAVCKKNGHALEAIIRTYCLNADLLRFILSVAAPEQELASKKIKVLLKVFIKESASHPSLKMIIHKQSLKSLQTWMGKMEEFFRELKMGRHLNPGRLQAESDKIFALLRISATKMLVNGKNT